MVPSFDSAILLIGILFSASFPSLINAIPYKSYQAQPGVSTSASASACQSSSGSTVTYTVTVTATRTAPIGTGGAGNYGGGSSSMSSIISTDGNPATSTYGGDSSTSTNLSGSTNNIVGTGGSSTTNPTSTYGGGTGGSSMTSTNLVGSTNSIVGTGGSSISVTPISTGTIVPTSTGGGSSTGAGSSTLGGYGGSTSTSTQGQYGGGSSTTTSTTTSTQGQYGGGSATTTTNSNYGIFYTGSPGSGTTSGSGIGTGTATGTGMKRGLGYNDPTNAAATPSPVTIENFGGSNSHVSWAYSWGSSMNKNFPSYLEFVPMLWNTSSVHTDSFKSDVEDALSRGSQHILAFNEPDICPHAPDWAGTTQACMDPQPAAEGYVTWIMPYAGRAKLGAPAVTNGDFSPPWLTSFMQDCYTLNCTIDFVPVHYYGGVGDITPYTEYLQKIYNIANNASIMAPGTPERKIWLTEFQANGDDSQQTQFLQDFFQWADSTSWMERYAWFAAIPDMSGSLVAANGTLTDLGQTYATT